VKLNSIKGFTPLGNNVSRNGAEVIINAEDNDVLVFKMDPRSNGFGLSH